MNIKIGELVEYVEELKGSHKRKVAHRETVIQDLLNVKEELEKELDGQAQLIDNLQKQVKVAEERVSSCTKCFKELEDAWTKRDQNTIFWFRVNNYPEDMSQNLLRYLLENK